MNSAPAASRVALWLIGHGNVLFGLLVIVAAKIAGTALVGRPFMLTRPRLMQMDWFANLYARRSAFKESLISMVPTPREPECSMNQTKRASSRHTSMKWLPVPRCWMWFVLASLG
jgi:hypothetical protein